MSIFKKIYKAVDSKVGGILPGGAETSGIVKGVQDSALGTFWDTHIGRKGFIGEAGEMLGLWDSGTTVDKKNKAIDALWARGDRMESRHSDTMNLMSQTLGTDLNLQNQKAIGSMNVGQGGLATDNSRANYINQAIQNNIKQKNQILASNKIATNKQIDAHEISMANIDDQVDAIRNS